VTLTYVWKVNGVVQQTTKTSNLTNTFDLSQANHGDKGQTVTVDVTPNDGKLDGTVVTATATVADSAAVINTVTLKPASPKTNDILTANVDATDPDGEAINFTYVWKVNGV